MKKFTLALAAPGLMMAMAAGEAVAEPVPYTFNKTHTTISASWDHGGFSRQSIDFTKYDGTLLLDFDNPANSSIEVEFALEGGYWVGAPESDRFENHLASPDLFDIAKFPTASFKATAFETADGMTGVMRGDLTIKGQTHPVSLNVRLNKRAEANGRQKAGFSADGVIDRSLWGMGFGAPAVPLELKISVETELDGPAPAQ